MSGQLRECLSKASQQRGGWHALRPHSGRQGAGGSGISMAFGASKLYDIMYFIVFYCLLQCFYVQKVRKRAAGLLPPRGGRHGLRSAQRRAVRWRLGQAHRRGRLIEGHLGRVPEGVYDASWRPTGAFPLRQVGLVHCSQPRLVAHDAWWQCEAAGRGRRRHVGPRRRGRHPLEARRGRGQAQQVDAHRWAAQRGAETATLQMEKVVR